MRVSVSKGFSLVEVMVSIGIMGIGIVTMITMMTNQSREIKSMEEKMQLRQLESSLTNLFANSSLCSCVFANSRFNSTTRVWTPTISEIGSSYSSTCNIVGPPLIRVNEKFESSLYPSDISFVEIQEAVQGSGVYTGYVNVKFDASRMVRALKDAKIPFYFTVNLSDPANSRSLLSCSAVNTTAPPLNHVIFCAQMGGVYSPTASPPCQITYQ
jgi:prepilin-type N-terminal cleavage/methylation domain-containing protein